MKKLLHYLILVFIIAACSVKDYKDPKLSVEERVESVLSQMTLDEKLAILQHATDTAEMHGLSSVSYTHLGEPIWDASILTEKVGADFMESIKYAGAENVIDMTPIGTGIDDFFIAAPSYPGRIYQMCIRDRICSMARCTMPAGK